MITSPHHVQVAAPPGSEQAARAFYGGVLEMTELDRPAALAGRGGAWFRSGAAEVHVGIEDGFTPARKAHPALLVDDLDAVIARLVAAGHHVTRDGALPGYRRCYVDDPHGNRLELIQSATSPR